MKIRKMIMVIAAVICIAGFAAPASAEENRVRGEFEDGKYIVHIADADLGWFAEDMVEDENVVKLSGAELVDEEYVITYEPVADGTATVGARHFYNAFASDEAYTWTLEVTDGKISQVTGGSYTANPDPEEADIYVSGEWISEGDQAVKMTINRLEGPSWDVEAVPAGDGWPYVFRASICYDCYKDAFVYDKGKYFNAPEEGAEDESLGEAVMPGMTGTLKFNLKEDNELELVWTDDHEPEEEIVFSKVIEEPDHYSMATAMSKLETEATAAMIKSAFLKQDWETLASYIDFPVLVNGTAIENEDAFLDYMGKASVSEEAVKAMEEESCRDMFVNGQGICMGSGQVWLNDPGYMTDASPELKIIAINDVTE